MKIWQKFKYGIFDIDGTLFDNVEIMINAFWEIMKKFDLPENDTRNIYRETNGMNLNDQFKLIFDKYGIKYDESLIEKLNKSFFELRDNSEEWKNSPLFPGIKELLIKLKESDVKNFISSGSNTDEIIFRLKKAEILEYFSFVLGADIIPKSAKHFEKFAEFSSISAEEFNKNAFLLSDGSNDMAIAKSAGIYAIGVTNTLNEATLKSAGADLIISNAEKLINFEF